jgi:hypothetical protein
MSSKLDELAHGLATEVARLVAEEKALKTKCEALRLTIAEFEERIGDHQKNLVTKQRLEELQRAAMKFASNLEARGY